MELNIADAPANSHSSRGHGQHVDIRHDQGEILMRTAQDSVKETKFLYQRGSRVYFLSVNSIAVMLLNVNVLTCKCSQPAHKSFLLIPYYTETEGFS